MAWWRWSTGKGRRRYECARSTRTGDTCRAQGRRETVTADAGRVTPGEMDAWRRAHVAGGVDRFLHGRGSMVADGGNDADDWGGARVAAVAGPRAGAGAHFGLSSHRSFVCRRPLADVGGAASDGAARDVALNVSRNKLPSTTRRSSGDRARAFFDRGRGGVDGVAFVCGADLHLHGVCAGVFARDHVDRVAGGRTKARAAQSRRLADVGGARGLGPAVSAFA